jgi:hypothetical protein
MSENCPLLLASRIERKWFKRTVTASGLALASFSLLMALSWWGGRISASLGDLQPSVMDQELDRIHHHLLHLFYAMSGSIVALGIFGAIFFGFFIRWIFAFRAHRREVSRAAA